MQPTQPPPAFSRSNDGWRSAGRILGPSLLLALLTPLMLSDVYALSGVLGGVFLLSAIASGALFAATLGCAVVLSLFARMAADDFVLLTWYCRLLLLSVWGLKASIPWFCVLLVFTLHSL